MMQIDNAIHNTVGHPGPIGVFDSGYGGLTILKDLRRALPDADYIYLGDNARAPYGTRSFDLVYHFTLDAVKYLFARDASLLFWHATRHRQKHYAASSRTTCRISTLPDVCLA